MLTRSVEEITICWPSSSDFWGGPVQLLFCKKCRLSICGNGAVFKGIKTLGLIHVVSEVVQGVDVETVGGKLYILKIWFIEWSKSS